MDTCPWPTEGESLHWPCHERTPVTAYRERMLNGAYQDTTKPKTSAPKRKTANTTTPKRRRTSK